MNAMDDAPQARRWPESARWAACFMLAVAFHGAGAAALLARWNDDDLVANAPVITIELAALPVAPETTPNEMPPGPQQQEAEPEPEPEKPLEKQLELPPDPKAEPLQAVAPPPKVVEKPREKKPKQKHASLASAPSSAETKSERAAAPMAGANSQNPNAVPDWKSQLVAKLERSKRYPSEAQSRGEQGIAQLAFSVDRGGGVHNARIVRSSGSSLLDRATLELVARAAPLPPPPPEIAGSQIPISVPIRYNVR
jgi:periplasmic protein TonB